MPTGEIRASGPTYCPLEFGFRTYSYNVLVRLERTVGARRICRVHQFREAELNSRICPPDESATQAVPLPSAGKDISCLFFPAPRPVGKDCPSHRDLSPRRKKYATDSARRLPPASPSPRKIP